MRRRIASREPGANEMPGDAGRRSADIRRARLKRLDFALRET